MLFEKKEKGSVLIETAVMFMIVTMIVTGYIFFLQAIRIHTVAKIAAREAAREYAVTNDAGQAKERAKSELALGGVDPKYAEIEPDTDGKKRIVVIRINRGFYIPFAGSYGFELKGEASYGLEQNPEFFN